MIGIGGSTTKTNNALVQKGMNMNYLYEKLRPHIGHNIVCVCYGKDDADPVDICIECEDCNEVLVSSEDVDE